MCCKLGCLFFSSSQRSFPAGAAPEKMTFIQDKLYFATFGFLAKKTMMGGTIFSRRIYSFIFHCDLLKMKGLIFPKFLVTTNFEWKPKDLTTLSLGYSRMEKK
jgi:hypothetical protein